MAGLVEKEDISIKQKQLTAHKREALSLGPKAQERNDHSSCTCMYKNEKARTPHFK